MNEKECSESTESCLFSSSAIACSAEVNSRCNESSANKSNTTFISTTQINNYPELNVYIDVWLVGWLYVYACIYVCMYVVPRCDARVSTAAVSCTACVCLLDSARSYRQTDRQKHRDAQRFTERISQTDMHRNAPEKIYISII